MTTYNKTDKGREEISARTYGLQSRMRTLLVMIDGRHPMEELLPKVIGIGLDASAVSELLAQGFIEEGEYVAPPPPPPVLPTEQELAAQFAQARSFYERTIEPTLGLRGQVFQAKLDAAATLEDLKAMRITFFEMVNRVRGRPVALALKKELDAILGVCSKEAA
ncbi:hypothetical protein [Pseudoduganella violaceinigra]|uniref:hypothetical protein n=1 Tax=Pseudoduganella violaceinigra TaxID=246602 RepID=UPI0003F79653|nr:hypothetical protein [Pseudoduganella violaceinigra]